MENKKMIMEPYLEYEQEYKEKFLRNTEDYYDNLVRDSKINIEENRETVKEIKSFNAKLSILENKKGFFSRIRGLLSFGFVFILFIVGVLSSIVLLKSVFTSSDISVGKELLYLFPVSFLFVIGLLYIFSLIVKGNAKKTRTTRIVFQILIIIVVGFTFIIRISKVDSSKFLVLSYVLITVAIVFLFADIVIKNNVIKTAEEKIDLEFNDVKSKRDAKVDVAYHQLSRLNSSFEYDIPSLLIQKTLPIIKMDKYLDANKAEYLYEKYGFKVGNENSSTIFMQSGTIDGNPFMICKDYTMKMINKTYTGTLTITWTTTTKINGRTVTIPHVQVLTASVTAPAPSYSYDQYLVYGNEAAPNLSFSRYPNKMSSKDSKTIEKYAQKIDNKLSKKVEQSISNGGTFQKLGNPEFEALFGGTDRDNEIEYRLLFTPLAQKNMLNILKSHEPYGDDFSFHKRKCLNFIRSYHHKNYSQDPTLFVNYDYDASRQNFINYNVEFFKSFYFELAPLLSIPLYQETRPKEAIYDKKVNYNFSMFEYEQMANSFNSDMLKHPLSITGNIYKTERISSIGNSDRIKIYANSFRGEKRVTYSVQLGGDGRMHTIPVYWIEYFPVQQVTEMLLTKADVSRNEFNTKSLSETFKNTIASICNGNAFRHEKNILYLLLANNVSNDSIKEFDSKLNFANIEEATNVDLTKVINDQLNATQASVQKEGSDALVEPTGDAVEVKEDNISRIEEIVESTEDPDLVDDEK